MAVIPVDHAQINFRFSGAACPNGAEVTIGANVSSYGGDPLAAGQDAAAAYVDNIGPIQPASVVLASVLVKFGPNATGPSAEFPVGTAGSGGGTAVAPNTAWLVHKVTTLGGRAGRGRMYFPGVQESEVDSSGVLSSGFVTGAQSAVTDFLNDLSTALLIPVLLHSETSPITTPTTITSLGVDSVAATQRRRLRG